MQWGFSWLLDFVNRFWSILSQLAIWMVHGVLYAVKMGLWFIWDGILTVLLSIIQSLDFGSWVASISGLWAGLPSGMVYIITQVGIPQGVTMLGYAYAIRLGLNLIPGVFTRI